MNQSIDTEKKKGIRILVVDDEEFLVNMWKLSLERRGYQVAPYTNCLEALRIFKEDPSAFDLAITDQTMPGMTGVTLATELLAIRKDMPIILCTGYSDLVNEEIAKKIGIREFIMKPFDINQLEAVMKGLIS